MLGRMTYAGEVRGQARPRFSRSGHAYKDTASRAYERRLAQCWAEQSGVCFDGPVRVSISVWRHLPRSKPRGVTEEPDTLKPDADNIAKAVLDALNGVAWQDDSQVVALSVRKFPRRRVPADIDILHVSVESEES